MVAIVFRDPIALVVVQLFTTLLLHDFIAPFRPFSFPLKASAMSSSALTVYPHLPPTTNVLDSQQRLRLMRSTRKLGAVLGTTPYLLENDTSFALLPLGKATSKALKRQGSIFTHSHSSSLSLASSSTSLSSSHHPSPSASSIALPQSVAPGVQGPEIFPLNPPGLSTTRRHRLGDKAPQLYLRLNTVPVSATDDRLGALLPPTPCSPTSPIPLSPPAHDAAEIRRRRMAKLARHLGENVPAELVLASEPTSKSSPTPPMRRRSRSVHVTRTEDADNKLSFSRANKEWVGEWNRSDIRDVQKELRNLRTR
ncbi:hypothetical protein V8E55_000998 [Tylopilus felleus]